MNRFRLALILGVLLLLIPVALAAAEGRGDVRGGVAFVNGAELDWVDPALDYISAGWQIEYVTCAQLVSYPTRRRRPRPSRKSRSRSTFQPTA